MRPEQRDLPNYHGPDPRGGHPVTPGVLGSPALGVLPFIRYPVGNKISRPGLALAWGLAAAVIAPLVLAIIYRNPDVEAPENFGWLWLVGFAGACFLGCVLNWAGRIRGLMQSGQAGGGLIFAPVHQLDAGYSWLARKTTLPLWLTEIVLVPGAFILVGRWIYEGPSRALGVWLYVIAFSLARLGVAELYHRVSVSGSITDMHLQGKATSASVGAFKARTGAAASGRQFAEDANAGMRPEGVAMHPEGSQSDGLFYFSFSRKSRAAKEAPEARTQPGSDRAKSGRNYAAPGE